MEILLVLIIGFLLSLAILSSIKNDNPMTDYDIYGPGGADEYEREMMGMSEEEYKEYNPEYIPYNKKENS